MGNNKKTLADFKSLDEKGKNDYVEELTNSLPDEVLESLAHGDDDEGIPDLPDEVIERLVHEKGNEGIPNLPDEVMDAMLHEEGYERFPNLPDNVIGTLIHGRGKQAIPKSNQKSVNPNIRDFVYYMIHNKGLTKAQQAKRDSLLALGYMASAQKSHNKSKQKEKKDLSSDHHPKKTADFLSLFNQRDGFKYLTHNYDNLDMDYATMLKQVRKVFEENHERQFLPKSLITLMRNFIFGKEWLDRNGTRHQEGFFSDKWNEWSIANSGRHPITNIGGIESEIQEFRHTIRVVSPDLQHIFDVICKDFPDFKFTTNNLDKADFYTNVYILRLRLQDIIKDLTDHNENKEINISYLPNFETEEYVSHIIRISQIGGHSAMPLEQAVKKFDNGGGFFFENAQKSCGYYNWSVESYWDGKPMRWNILNDSGADIIEPISSNLPIAFTHILTFYSK